MSDREKKIAEIWEALEKATPGPWEYEMWEGCADVYPTTGRHVPICQLWTKTEEPMENAENNAHLIANAPEWLRFLLTELEKKDVEIGECKEHCAAMESMWFEVKTDLDREREDNRKLQEERDDYMRYAEEYRLQLQSAQQEIERLREEREKLIEGLRKIANDDDAWLPMGRIARDILRELGVNSDE